MLLATSRTAVTNSRFAMNGSPCSQLRSHDRRLAHCSVSLVEERHIVGPCEPALNPYGLPFRRPRKRVRKTTAKTPYSDVGKPGPGMCTTLEDSHVVVQCVLKSPLSGLVAGHVIPRALRVPPPLGQLHGDLCCSLRREQTTRENMATVSGI
jgi:hypothetical protein